MSKNTNKPIMILSPDTETGGFNCRVNALMTVGIATIELKKHTSLVPFKRKNGN